MNILFLCTSLEPGRDGVGDYARLLAEACVDAGHGCQLIALNDQHIVSSGVEVQRGREHDLHCLRLAPTDSWSDRIAAAREYAQEFSPDWLSWQVVPYGFNPKGVIPHEASGFSLLGRNRNVHVMLHEMWIGLSRGEPLKNRSWGILQRRALMRFLGDLQPTLMHTSNVSYQAVLAREGCHVGILPLFGNIPVTEIVATPPDTGKWVGGIFGTIHPQLQPHPCFDVLLDGARASGRQLRILGIGRLGGYGEQMLADLEKAYGDRIEVALAGERPPEEISRLLQTLEFGIATHPWGLLGKSGAVAAMLDHGLPVIVPRDDWVLRSKPIYVPPIDPLVIKLSDMPPELMAGRLTRKRHPSPRLPDVAATFLASLEAVTASTLPEA